MYRDSSLIPSEAVRLAALGILEGGPRSYAELASEVRRFTGSIVGPSLDLMGPSIELLKVEGLIEAVPGMDADAVRLAPAGRDELRRLLTAPPRGPFGGLNRLVVALKMRFLHLLEPSQRMEQIELLVELGVAELARLADLNRRHAGEPGYLVPWLERDLAEAEARVAWLRQLLQRAQ